MEENNSNMFEDETGHTTTTESKTGTTTPQSNPAGQSNAASYGDRYSAGGQSPYGQIPPQQPMRDGYGMPPYQRQQGKKDGHAFGIASLACGVLALLLFCTCINVPLAIMSIIFGVVQVVGYKEKLLAGIGIVLSAASLILMIIAFMVFANLSLDMGNFENGAGSYEEYFEQYFNRLEDGSF